LFLTKTALNHEAKHGLASTQEDGKILKKTLSLCPECLRLLPAEVYVKDGKVWISKTCPEHGEYTDLYWASYEMYKKAERFAVTWRGVSNPNIEKDNPSCPHDCGLCSLHLSHTALANIVVTNRCDLACWYCFFFAEKAGYVYEPTLEQIRFMVRALRNEKPVPCNAVQLTGGEPCLRDDLVDIIRVCKEEGIDHVQLNTDGIRLALDPELALKVRKAGVNTIYLSFDGVTSKTNPKNHREIPKILENCRKAGVGIVLVPTIIKTVNDHEVGAILKFGFENIDVVRGVNYQPVSLVGRISRAEVERFRITIPEVILRIEEQTNGEISREDFYPVPTAIPITQFVEAFTGKPKYALSTHFACGMATYVFKVDGKLIPITRFVDVEGLLEYLKEKAEEIKAGKNKYLVLLKTMFKLRSFVDKEKQPKGLNLPRLLFEIFIRHNYEALGKFHHKSLFIGMMHFQDLYNWDIERVRRCCIHYTVPDGRIIPFCAFNVIPQWYRDKIQKEFGIPIEEWEKRTGKKLKDDLYRRVEPT
jgi:hypothetical protein